MEWTDDLLVMPAKPIVFHYAGFGLAIAHVVQ
jgi:hypothetical protein